jgi:type II secretory pathway component GspD/PulD (secretin)
MLPLLRYICATAILLGASLSAYAQDRHLHTYAMRHAVPEQVLPALMPQLSASSSANAFQNQLILNVTDAEYRDVLTLLDQLDVAARSLLISVRNAGSVNSSNSDYGVDGRIGSGNIQMQTGSRIDSSRTEIRAINNNQYSNRNGSQQVRAIEGMPAFIAAGSSVPLTTRSSVYGASYGTTRELVPVETGFYATARVIGNDVIIDVDQRDDRVQGREIKTQGVQTQVRGRVGEWIPLGAIAGSQSRNDRGLTGAGNSSQTSNTDIAIKVELAPQ